MASLPAGFLPSRDGFAFTNSWPPAPGVAVRTPFGTLGIGNAGAGLCGGMVFAALDYWMLRIPPPRSQPAPGSPLYRHIVRRLIDSWHIPSGVARYYEWMNLPDADGGLSLRGRTLLTLPGLGTRTVGRHWPRVRASLDSGMPAVLGLVTVDSAWPGLLGHNHQVLAYGYEQDARSVSLRVYDPNTGRSDDVRIAFGIDGRGEPVTFRHNIDIGWPVRGFFATPYSPAAPPPLPACAEAAGSGG